jgi:hypothetical protein
MSVRRCSITGGRGFESMHQAIVRLLAESGVMVLETVIDPADV